VVEREERGRRGRFAEKGKRKKRVLQCLGGSNQGGGGDHVYPSINGGINSKSLKLFDYLRS